MPQTKQPSAKQPPPIVARSISINQPWCWAIAAGYKSIENRTWATDYRGYVALHAGSSKRHLENDVALEVIFACHERIPEQWDNESIDDDNPLLHFGAIIGAAKIIGCIEFHPERGDDFEKLCRAAGFGEWYDRYEIPPDYWAEGPFCFLLDEVKQFTQPPAARGKLRIYRLSPAEILAVAKCLRAPLGCPVEYRAKLNAAKKNAAAALAEK